MNNYKGYLLKFNGTVFPNNYMLEFSSTPDQRMDVDSERDNLGTLHRSVLPDGKTSIKFSTHILSLDDKITMQNIIWNAINANGTPEERNCFIEYWNDEINDYDKGCFYIPDIQYVVMDASATNIRYQPISIELIEY